MFKWFVLARNSPVIKHTGRQHFAFCLKAHVNGRNKSQHYRVLLGFMANNVASVLHGPKSLTDFKLYATSANIAVVLCKRTQHVGPKNVTCSWPTMLRPFTWALVTLVGTCAYSLKPVKLLAQQVPTSFLFCDRRSVASVCMVSQHCWPRETSVNSRLLIFFFKNN